MYLELCKELESLESKVNEGKHKTITHKFCIFIPENSKVL